MTETAQERPHYQATFVVLMVAVSSYALLQSLVLPVLPTIQKGLHTTQTNVTWVLTAYLLSASIFTPIFGRVGDMIGKKKVLVGVLLALLLAGSVISALATNLILVMIARPGHSGRRRRRPARWPSASSATNSPVRR